MTPDPSPPGTRGAGRLPSTGWAAFRGGLGVLAIPSLGTSLTASAIPITSPTRVWVGGGVARRVAQELEKGHPEHLEAS